MFLDPSKLEQANPAELFESAAQGHIGLDQRFLRALANRRDEALPAAVTFAARSREEDPVDLAPELIALFHYWKAPEGVSFLVEYIKEDLRQIPDDAVAALVHIGAPALEPLLSLYHEIDDESENGEIAFILASLHIRDERILQRLLERMEYDVADTAFLLSVYGDTAAIPALDRAEAALGANEFEVKREIEEAKQTLQTPPAKVTDEEPFDLYEAYPEEADPPIDVLDDDERLELFEHPVESLRAAAANSFFNRELTAGQRAKLLHVATTDPSATVRARAWESLGTSTEEPDVIAAMLQALHKSDLPAEERGGLLVGLSSEADRNEVRSAINELYNDGHGRAKALEAMWRSMHPSFRDNFARHIDDPELEVRRGAVWGVGYYGLKSELDKIRSLFENEDLRSDALFAYALAIPADVSRGRMKGLLARIEKDARGLSDMEEELVKLALDERLMIAGKEPYFAVQED